MVAVIFFFLSSIGCEVPSTQDLSCLQESYSYLYFPKKETEVNEVRYLLQDHTASK